MTAAGQDRRRRTAPGGRFLEGLLIDGRKADADVTGRVVAAKLTRAVDSASYVELTLDDSAPPFKLIRSGALTARRRDRPPKRERAFQTAAWARFGDSRLTLDGVVYRLGGIGVSYDANGVRVTLTFEDEVAALLRRYQGRFRKARRGALTRGRFVALLAHEVRERTIDHDIPEIDERQQVRRSGRRARREDRERGISRDADLTAKGAVMVRSQIRTAERVLAVADGERSGERAALALLVACIVEPDRPFGNPTFGTGSSVGILQLLDIHLGRSASTDGGRRDIELVCRMFLRDGFAGKGGAIRLAAENPSWTVGEIAQAVQSSDYPDRYDEWAQEARKILDAYGGTGRIVLDRKEYEFHRGRDESSWQCLDRLATEVNVRYMADMNVLHYVSDDYLHGLRPVFTIDPDDEAIVGLQLEEDVGVVDGEIVVRAVKPRNTGRPGIPAQVKGLGSFNGKWLIKRIEEDLFEQEPATIVLYRPSPQLPEPAPETARELRTETTPERGSVRDRIIHAAEKTLTSRTGHNYYLAGGETTTDPLAKAPLRSDCSQWVRAIYLRAGAEDPGINTHAQIANGTRTSDPRPGDLAFPQDGSHVELYAGNGKTYGHGTAPIDEWSVAGMRDVFGPGVFFMTYPSLDG